MKTILAFLKRYWLVLLLVIDGLWLLCELHPPSRRLATGGFEFLIGSIAMFISLLDIRKWSRTEYFVVSGLTLPLWFMLRVVPFIQKSLQEAKPKNRKFPVSKAKRKVDDKIDPFIKAQLDRARRRR